MTKPQGNTTRERPFWAQMLPVLWIAAVLAAYYGYNFAYYREKIGTFAAFFLR